MNNMWKVSKKRFSKGNLIILLLIAMLVIFFVSMPSLAIMLGIISPGFEGAKCYGYGADFRWGNNWPGTYILHRYQDAEEPLVSNQYYGSWDRIYWATVATPNDMRVGWQTGSTHLITGAKMIDKEYPTVGIQIESNIQLQDINRQGDPLGWDITDPMSGKRIEYWAKTPIKEETADKVLYHYTVTKESFIVAPSEFWVGFYLLPDTKNAGTGSGWREGEWNNIVIWFMLDFTVWDNAYKDSWLDDPKINVFTNDHEGKIISRQRTDDYRGGFPIAGWVQGWEKAGWTSVGPEESPVWLQTKGKEDKTYTIDQLAQLKEKLMAKVDFTPGLVGQFLSLYNTPSATFDYEPSMLEGNYADDDVTQYTKTPDSRMQKTMYFPINIGTFGTLVQGDFWHGWTIYYPSAYFRIRMLYGVYGNFTYLWTEELAKDPTVNYPEEPERHGTTVITIPGIKQTVFGWTDWFANPFNQLWLFFILIIIVLVIVTVFNPGVWATVALTLRKGR